MLILFKMYQKILLFFIIIPAAKCARPGVYFWRPRLALDLAIPTTRTNVLTYSREQNDLLEKLKTEIEMAEGLAANRVPSKENIARGTIVLIEGYAAGLTVISLAAGITSVTTYPYLDITGPYFYTNLYRWGLRYMSLIPQWMGGRGGHYVHTHKTWVRRFYYMDEFMPGWMQKCLPFVKKEDWDKEYIDWKRYKKYAESAFGKHYRYPTKHFNEFHSMDTDETVELNYQEVSSESI